MQGGVVFRVGSEPYYLPATIAMRVVPVPRIGRVPGGPVDLVGVALVENEMVPVVSVGASRSAMLVVQCLGEPVGIVGIDIVATGRVVDEHTRLFDVSALVARLRETRWAV